MSTEYHAEIYFGDLCHRVKRAKGQVSGILSPAHLAFKRMEVVNHASIPPY